MEYVLGGRITKSIYKWHFTGNAKNPLTWFKWQKLLVIKKLKVDHIAVFE